MPTVLLGLSRIDIPLQPYNIVGVAALRRLANPQAPLPQPTARVGQLSGVELPHSTDWWTKSRRRATAW